MHLEEHFEQRLDSCLPNYFYPGIYSLEAVPSNTKKSCPLRWHPKEYVKTGSTNTHKRLETKYCVLLLPNLQL